MNSEKAINIDWTASFQIHCTKTLTSKVIIFGNRIQSRKVKLNETKRLSPYDTIGYQITSACKLEKKNSLKILKPDT